MRYAVDFYLRVGGIAFVEVPADDPDPKGTALDKASAAADKAVARMNIETFRVYSAKETLEDVEPVTGGWRKPRKRRRK
jgi:hypothetical protein